MPRPIPDDLSMLASFYRRWEPQEDRRREISEDLKTMFKDGKDAGFNSKAMRKAFAAQYRLDHEDSEQREAREQTDEETELYMSALARVRESDADEPNVPVTDGGEAKSIRSSRTGGEEPTPSSKFPASDKQWKTGLGYESTAVDQLSVRNNVATPPRANTPVPDAEAKSTGGERSGAQAAHGFSGGDAVQLGVSAVSDKPPVDTLSANSNLTPNQIPVVASGVKVEHRGTVGTR